MTIGLVIVADVTMVGVLICVIAFCWVSWSSVLAVVCVWRDATGKRMGV